jgi:hypothetical protein
MNKPFVLGRMPPILTEEATLARALGGTSLSRFGDGELRLALGGSAVSQVSDLNLQDELCQILRGPTKSLVCLPHYNYGPKVENWQKYGVSKFTNLYKQAEYGSAFISRPDSAPNIQTEKYWTEFRKLWKGRDSHLVVGTDCTSLNERMLRDARSLRVLYGPRRDAYSEARRLEDDIGTVPANQPIILCLGATATVLAERLARKGMWALDLGHAGKLMPKEYR